MTKIVTLTLNPTVDLSSSVESVFPEAKLRCSRPQYDPGGGGVNVSRAIKKLGGESRAFWLRGGTTGHVLQELLEREHLDHVPLEIKDTTRENLIILDRSNGQQYRFGMPGPEVTATEVASVLERMRKLDPAPEYFVASGSLPPGVHDDFYARVIEHLPAECRVIVDTSGEALQRALEAHVFLLKPNLRELGLLVGEEMDSDRQIEQATDEIIRRGKAEVIVVSLGSGGALLVTAAGRERIASPTVPIRSKVGAGDSMVAGLVVALQRGWSVSDAARFAVAAGAAAVMTPGTELCQRADTERLYDTMRQMEGG